MARKKEKKEKKTYPWWVEMPIIIVVTLLLLGAFNTFVGRLYLIPSESMEQTLHGCNGCTPDRIFVNKLAYGDDESPEPGDVCVKYARCCSESPSRSVRASARAASTVEVAATR